MTKREKILVDTLKQFERKFGKCIDTEEPINGGDAVDFICEYIFEVRRVLTFMEPN